MSCRRCLSFVFSVLASTAAFAEIQNSATLSLKTQYEETAQTIIEAKRTLAVQFAVSYNESKLNLKNNINQYRLAIDVSEVYRNSRDKKQLSLTNKLIRSAKGLDASGENLIQLRMASQKMVASWQTGVDPLFAFAPSGEDSEWTRIEAYDKDGKLHWLDVHVLPERPIFIVELNGKKVLQEGLKVMRRILSMDYSFDSLQSGQLLESSQALSTSVLKKIRLNDDEEPWISGAAEIYAVTTGVSPSRKEPVLDVVDLPYLDDDNKDYYPNQILIHWGRYRWKAVDILLMEQDDNTNYKTLAISLLNIATQILQSIPIPDVQGYSIIPLITNGILNALPDDWFINNDDYVDTFYTIFENQEYLNHSGARANATITLSPLEIPRS